MLCIASVYICTIFCKTVFIISYRKEKGEDDISRLTNRRERINTSRGCYYYILLIVPIVISQSTVYFLIIVSCNVISEIRYLTENICQLYSTLNASFLFDVSHISLLFIYSTIDETRFLSININETSWYHKRKIHIRLRAIICFVLKMFRFREKGRVEFATPSAKEETILLTFIIIKYVELRCT